MLKLFMLLTGIVGLTFPTNNGEVSFEEHEPNNSTLVHEISEEMEAGETAEILFTGDVMLGRYVETLMNKNGKLYPFEMVKNRFSEADTVIINLEGPVLRSQRHRHTPDFTTNFSFDESILGTLKETSIDVVNLSNNHTLDKGAEVYEEMIQLIEDANIAWFGHPKKWEDRYIKTIDVNGFTITLMGFHQATNYEFDIEEAKKVVSTWKDKYPNDVLIANIHHGPEYIKESSDLQKVFGRGLIDAGSDVVIGHHPHVVQEMEIYNEKPIFYSLGNFVFDQYFSADTQEGLVVGLNLSKDNDDVKMGLELLPIKSKMSQPYFLEAEERLKWVEDYIDRSNFTWDGVTEEVYLWN